MLCSIMLYFFFFQAEDGIRDYKVTGVQTCALPISAKPAAASTTSAWAADGVTKVSTATTKPAPANARRSEERRVGKECRCWRVLCEDIMNKRESTNEKGVKDIKRN